MSITTALLSALRRADSPELNNIVRVNFESHHKLTIAELTKSVAQILAQVNKIKPDL